ncbi:MAG: serine/threonine-protein kinase [Pirellulaceae bacterium]
MNTVRQKFRESAVTSGLVSEVKLATALSSLRKPTNEVSDRELANKLVEMKALTAYQADQLMSGRTKLTLGPYMITDWIGQGGMGQVFKAVHNMLGRECAVKVLPLSKTTPDAIENFRREIRAQARLDHVNLVRAYDAGEDGNVHYLVVEYVPGTDLRRLVRNKGFLPVNQAASVVRQAAKGLKHAHERNLIHRDIKPGNILVTPDGIVKLSDLGLAYCLTDPDDPRLGKIVGTADYLSPEQIKSPMDVTEVSDIYSLGCTLYYAITGKVPFPGGTTKSKARRHIDETPWHPRRFNEEVSDEFVDLIGDMMEKNPAERIQTAEEVIERLAPWAQDDDDVRINENDKPSRWQAAPIPSGDEDTDPNDIGDLALNEMSGGSDTNASISGTLAMEPAKGQPRAPSPPGNSGAHSVIEQFKNVRRLPSEALSFGFATLVITVVSCLAVGIFIGFVLGYFMR